jgi:hypothetical protein
LSVFCLLVVLIILDCGSMQVDAEIK